MTSCARGSAFRVALFGAVSAAAALAGCASGGGSGPGSKALANGETCGSVKQQLNKLDSKGVPQWVQAQSAGKKISAQQKADADLYNKLLDDYLGARCHV
jgi:hypothetical protein